MAALPARATPYDRLYTADEFMALSLDPSKRYELVRGVIKEMSHPGWEHVMIQDNLYSELSVYVRAKGLGRVIPPGSFELNLDPKRDTVRAPDLAFISKKLVEKLGRTKGAIDVTPDLAVEVYSPNDRPGELRDKLTDYQTAGWDLVWVIYPPESIPKSKSTTVEVYRLQQGLNPIRILGENDVLDGEEVIPGFKMSIVNLFE
jgi:Uma2 family endonuclease